MIKELVVKVIKTCTRYKGTKLNNGKVKSYRTASYFKYIHVNYKSPSEVHCFVRVSHVYHKEAKDDDFLCVFTQSEVSQVLLLDMLLQKCFLPLALLWLLSSKTAPRWTVPPLFLQKTA